MLIVTDSKYLMNGAESWMAKWKRNSWSRDKAGRKPVLNVDLWKELDGLISLHSVEWRWVRGHTGHPGNERADTLAGEGAKGKRIRRVINELDRKLKEAGFEETSAELAAAAKRDLKPKPEPVKRQSPVRREDVKLDKHTTKQEPCNQYRLDGDSGWT